MFVGTTARSRENNGRKLEQDRRDGRADFTSMRMVVTTVVHRTGTGGVSTEFLIERTDDGWKMRLTDESHRKKVEAARHDLETLVPGETDDRFLRCPVEQCLDALERGPRWEPMIAPMFEGIEEAYGRFVGKG